jgi:hypothetical protein
MIKRTGIVLNICLSICIFIGAIDFYFIQIIPAYGINQSNRFTQ